MKKILTIAMFCIAAIGYSQDIKPTYEAEGALVKATYYHEDGTADSLIRIDMSEYMEKFAISRLIGAPPC